MVRPSYPGEPGPVAVAFLAAVLAVTAGVSAPAAGQTQTAESVLVVQPTVEPRQPTTDANATFVARVTNTGIGTGTGLFFLDRVAVRNTSDPNSELYGLNDSRTRVRDNETVTPTTDIDLDTPGERTLYLHLDLQTPSGDRTTVVRPVSIRVRDPDPTLSLAASTVDADNRATLNLTVANGLDEPVRNLDLTVRPSNATLRDGRRVAALLAAGDARTFGFTADSVEPGSQTVTATLSYTADDGTRRTISERLTAAATDRAGVEPRLAATVAPVGASGETTVTVDVVNPREGPIRGVTVGLAGDLNLAERRAVRSTVAAGSAATLQFDTGSVTPGPGNLTATLTYTADGVERELVRELPVRVERVANPGNVSLTGLRVTRGGGRLTVRGSASNVGTANVTGVVVAVGDGETVRPARSGASFFVGDVPSGEFTSFEVSGRLAGNVSGPVTIPLEVRYVTDGVGIERTVTVAAAAPERSAEPADDGDDGPPLALLGGVVLLVGGGLAYRRWR